MSTQPVDNRAALVLIIALVGLALLGWFMLAGQDDMVPLAVGALVAIVGGGFFGVIGQRLPVPIALGVAVGMTAMGLLFLHLLSSESRYFDYGATTASVRAVTYSIAGLFFGLAGRAVVLALLREPRP